MLSTVRESDGDYDEVLTQVLTRPRAEVSRAINHIHGRLLWCQIDPDDLRLLAARVIVPAAASVLGSTPGAPPRDPVLRADMVDLMALLTAPTDAGPRADFDKVLAAIRADPELQRLYSGRVATAQRQRTSPPPMVKKVNFCGAASGGDGRDAAMN